MRGRKKDNVSETENAIKDCCVCQWFWSLYALSNSSWCQNPDRSTSLKWLGSDKLDKADWIDESTFYTPHLHSNKMAESAPNVKPPEALEISAGNPAQSWVKWKQKFEIYLKAIGASKKPDEMKVGLLLNHSNHSIKSTQISCTYPNVMIPRGGKISFRPKILTTMRLLSQS